MELEKRKGRFFCFVNFSTHQSSENLLTMRCELLGVIPARGSVRHYCCSRTYLLDVSHVQDRKKLENFTRGYSDRCSYASPFFRAHITIRRFHYANDKILSSTKVDSFNQKWTPPIPYLYKDEQSINQ